MLLAYLDESSTKPWYFITSVVCNQENVENLRTKLDELDPDDRELHGKHLFRGTGRWKGMSLQEATDLYDKALEVIASDSLGYLIRGIDTNMHAAKGYVKQYSSHTVALTYLLETLDIYAESLGEQVLVIADQIGSENKHREEFRTYTRHQTWGWRKRKLSRLLDTIHFAPSWASRLIQAADLVAYVHRRFRAFPETDPERQVSIERLWQTLEPKIVVDYPWAGDEPPWPSIYRIGSPGAGG